MVTVWLGLGTKTIWLGLGKHHVLVQTVACTDFLKGRGGGKKKRHIQHVLTTEEGTLACVFATQGVDNNCRKLQLLWLLWQRHDPQFSG